MQDKGQTTLKLQEWQKIHSRIISVLVSGYGWVTVKVQDGKVVLIEHGFTEK